MRRKLDRSGDVITARTSREAVSFELNDYFEALKGYCPVHFAAGDILKPCTSYECDKLSPQAEWANYTAFRRSFNFDNYTYCFSCGAPNDQESENYFVMDCHPMPYRGRCPWNHFLFKTIFILWLL